MAPLPQITVLNFIFLKHGLIISLQFPEVNSLLKVF